MTHAVQASEITPDVIKRFLSKVVKRPNGCWIWQGATRSTGVHTYPVFSLKGHSRNPRFVAWFMKYTETPDKFFRMVCHNSLCVCPDHLITTDRIDEAVEGGKATRIKPGERLV